MKFIQDNDDASKQVDIDVSAVAHNATRLVSVPDRSGTLFDASSTVIDPAIGDMTATDVRGALVELLASIKSLQSITGQFAGSASTMAGLNAIVHGAGDWAILTADDGTHQAGIYVGNGTTFSLGMEIPDTTSVSGRIVASNTTIANLPAANLHAENYALLTAQDGSNLAGLYKSDGTSWTLLMRGIESRTGSVSTTLLNSSSYTFEGNEFDLRVLINMTNANVLMTHPTYGFNRMAAATSPTYSFKKVQIPAQGVYICVRIADLVYFVSCNATATYSN